MAIERYSKSTRSPRVLFSDSIFGFGHRHFGDFPLQDELAFQQCHLASSYRSGLLNDMLEVTETTNR
jgi:hypothetical protein